MVYPIIPLITPAFAISGNGVIASSGVPASATYGSQFAISASSSVGGNPTVNITADGSNCTGSGSGTNTANATITMKTGTGSCTISYTDGTVADNASDTVTAQKATLTVSGITANNKTYDTNTTATLNTGSAVLNGVISGDTVTPNYGSATGTFSDKTVGNSKTVQVSGITTDANTNNYSLTQPTTTANVTAASLTVTGVTASDKTYDGTTTATVDASAGVLVGVLGSDTVTLNYSSQAGTFSDKNVGTGKTVQVSGLATGGADGGNYTITQPTTTASISKRNLAVTAIGVDRQYDSTTNATVNLSSDKVSGDDLTLAYTSASFPDKLIGTGKTVSVSGISVSGGADAGNYNAPNATTTTTANITTYTLTANITASNKVYDQTNAATITGRSLVGVFGSDNVTISGGTATFSDKNAGNGKTVSATGLTLGGTDAGNYAYDGTATTTANITQKTVTVSGITASNKVYDQLTSTTLDTSAAVIASGVIAGDTVTLDTTGATGNFSDKNVATGKTVTVTGLTLGGADGGNYSVTSPTTTANITQKNLTVSGVTASNKVYDRTTTATLDTSSAALVGVIAGDTVTLGTGSAAGVFSDFNVGTGKTVTVSGLSISGGDSGNYSLTQPTTTANITQAPLTVTANNQTKIYGNTVTPAGTEFTTSGLISGDSVSSVTLNSTGFTGLALASVGTYSIVPSAASGSGLSNYSITYQNGTLTVNQRTLNVTADSQTKIYGDSDPSFTFTDDRVNGDAISGALTRQSGENVGTYNILQGTLDAGTNYIINFVSNTLSILQRTLNVVATGVNKTYDQTTSASVTFSSDALSADLSNLNIGGTAAFSDKNVGVGKTVSVSSIGISGSAAGNYTLASTTTTAIADISALALTATATGVDKIYDGTNTANVNFSDNRISGDSLTVNYGSATFADKNVGVGKTVSVTGINITGTDSGNYSFNTTANALANISQLALTISASGVNRVYDGTTNSTVSLSDNRLSGDVLTTSYGSATFADKNVGIGKTVSVSSISISGTDAANYSYNTTASTLANISQKALTISATGINKIYDASTSATVNLSDDRISGDSLTTSYIGASFADKNVGIGKTVSVSGISISGTDSGNYTFNTSASTLANISQLALTVSASGINKYYDGTATASATLSDNRLSGDSLSTSYSSASFADANVGVGKTVSVTGISISGTDAGNYSYNTTAQTLANIMTSATQTVLTPNTVVSSVTPQVIVGTTVSDSTVNIPSDVNNATLVFLVSGNQTTLNNALTINSSTSIGSVNVVMPAGTTITGPSGWDGTMNAPQVQANNSVTTPTTGGSTSAQEVVEVGLGDTPLTLSKAVKITLPNSANSPVGFSRSGVFTEISTICADNTQATNDANLAAGGDCKIAVGNDMVIWTKHFTKFVSYVTQYGAGSFGTLQNNTTNAPVCGDQAPTSAPSFISAVAGQNSVTLTWNKASDPVTYYLITYGDKSGAQTYGNPNVGGRNTTSYTVSGLSGGTTYYFRIRAGNNCMPGSYSTEISATPYGGSVSGPASGFIQGVLGTSAKRVEGTNQITEEESTSSDAKSDQKVEGTSATQTPAPQTQNPPVVGGILGAILHFFARLFGGK